MINFVVTVEIHIHQQQIISQTIELNITKKDKEKTQNRNLVFKILKF